VRVRRILSTVVALVASIGLTVTTSQAAHDGPGARSHHSDRYLNYAVLGDSITAGAGTSDYTFDATGTYVRIDHRWGYGEQAGLRAYGVGAACISGDWCGFGPDATDRVALRWFPTKMRALSRRPATVITEIGINDLATGHTAEEVIAGLQVLRIEGLAFGIRVVFGTVGPSTATSPGFNVTQSERLRLNDWIRQTQRSYVDYARALEGPDGWLRPEYESSFHDVHPNDAGAAAMAAVVHQWVQQDARAR
jgi:lysophospholipase L1-like esterase